MRAYLALPLLAALVATACGAAMAALSPRERGNQLGALVMASVAFWAACEVLWNVARDAESALLWHRVAAPGFLFVGPHAAWFVCLLHGRGLPRVGRLVPWLYGVNAGFLALCWSGDWMLAGMARTDWGWCLVPGPLLVVWLATTLVTVSYALGAWVRASRRSGEPRDGVYAARVSLWVALVAALAASSDVLLALAGVNTPRVGSLAVSTAGLAILSALGRQGFSRLNSAGVARRMLQILPDGVMLVRTNGRILLANPRAAELLDCGEAGPGGRLLSDHLALPVLGADAEYHGEECELLQASGRRIPVAVSTAALRTRSGELRGAVVILRDLREVVGLRARLLTSSRLAVVGQLASGIAHEINNPLAFVRANLHHLARECGELAAKLDASPETLCRLAADLEEVVGESLEGVERALHIVDDVSAFSHLGGDALRKVDLDEEIEQALAVAVLGLPPGVRVERRYGRVPEIQGSPQRLKQLFLNLLVNALRAVGEHGQVAVETRREGGRVVVTVSDDGCGIPPEDLARIFDPFFTTRPAGDGTGLGLAICHEIVRSHGGTIEVESEPRRGTRVRVSLPLPDAAER
jgi:signal transduction histidine kinase